MSSGPGGAAAAISLAVGTNTVYRAAVPTTLYHLDGDLTDSSGSSLTGAKAGTPSFATAHLNQGLGSSDATDFAYLPGSYDLSGDYSVAFRSPSRAPPRATAPTTKSKPGSTAAPAPPWAPSRSSSAPPRLGHTPA